MLWYNMYIKARCNQRAARLLDALIGGSSDRNGLGRLAGFMWLPCPAERNSSVVPSTKLCLCTTQTFSSSKNVRYFPQSKHHLPSSAGLLCTRGP